MSKIEVDAIDKQSGSTLTLGGSGTAVTLACGATQSGFGATGGISWQTAIKAGDFTAVSGEGYFVNTSGGSDITVTLPASPSAGNVVAIKDYARTFGTNKVIIARNGSNMDGTAANTNLTTSGLSVTFVFMDATKGWSLINDDDTSVVGASFVAATGGTITTVCTNFKVHTFTGPGTFCVSNAGNLGGSNTVDYLVIAGGGAGGGGSPSAPTIGAGGGGGAGGTRFSNGTASGCYTAGPSPLGATALPVSAQAYPITVGGGGVTSPSGICATGGSGSNTIFSSITSTGGGGAGSTCGPTKTGLTGGSGGGSAVPGGVGAAGNTPPVSPPQGNPGGDGDGSNYHGGGGGAAAAGSDGGSPPNSSGPGGAGFASSITGSPVARGGGGGGGVSGAGSCAPSYNVGTGGLGGGGNGQLNVSVGAPPNTGTTNSGSGGGGGGDAGTNGGAGNGGSGIVIIRYKFQ